MAERDTVLAVLQSDIGLIGLILVFAGFLLAKAEGFETKRGDKFRIIALLALVPIGGAIISAWISIGAIEGSQWDLAHSLLSLKAVLVLTGIYSVFGLILSAR